MFCPNCRTEYQHGYSTCNDCHVPLVEILPDEEKPDPIPDAKFIPVMETRNAVDIAEIKTVLEAEGITFYIQNEEMSIGYRSRSAKLLVLQDDVDKAVQLLNEMKPDSFTPGYLA